LPESNVNYKWYFPKDVIRIGCPHGLDISLKDTIFRYGGALVYDYILSPTQSGHRYSDPLSVKIPKSLCDNSSAKLCAIPMGFPKLDAFVNRTKACTSPVKIVYHLSNWLLETGEVRKNVGTILQALVNYFTDVVIVFRPFPGDLARQELSIQIDQLRKLENFCISQGTSYIEDYANADLLITHRQHTGEMFCFATGRPIFCLDYHLKKPVVETPFGLRINTIHNLCFQIDQYLDDPVSMKARLDQNRKQTTLNVGVSMQYLLAHMPVILNREQHPEWLSLDLYQSNDTKYGRYSNILVCLKYLFYQSSAFNHISEAALACFPGDPAILFYAAESQSRTPDPFQHTYYFQCRYKALQYICAALDHVDDLNIELATQISDWILHKGQYLAQSLLYQHETAHLDFTHDIESIFNRLNGSKSRQKIFKYFSPALAEKRLLPSYPFDFQKLKCDSKLQHITSVVLYGRLYLFK
jgi:hypothetical protein